MSKPNHRVFVFSLPRSGSSMMTGICERLGVAMKYTTEDEASVKKREESERKRYGATYRMNPKFYEITRNQFQHWHDIYTTSFSGCKVIIPVGGMRLEAVFSQPAKVIMMWRDPAEIRQSQEASYKKARASYTGPDDQEPWEHAEACLRTHLANTEVMLQRRANASNEARFFKGRPNEVMPAAVPDVSWDSGAISVPHSQMPTYMPGWVPPFAFKIVKYRDVLADPKKKITEIAHWIGADPSLVDYAVSSVDPDKIRFKKEELTEDI